MTSTAEHRVASAKDTAAEEGKHVAGVAKEGAHEVLGEVKKQTRGLLEDARVQVTEQSQAQRDRLVQTMRVFADELQQMAGRAEGSGLAANLVGELADRTRTLGSQLEGREPGELLDQARNFARRRPGTFLLGAAVAGVVAGRLARGAKAGSPSQSESQQGNMPAASTTGHVPQQRSRPIEDARIGGTTVVGAAEPLATAPDSTFGTAQPLPGDASERGLP